MEKKKYNKLVINLIIIAYLLVFSGLLLLQIWIEITGSGFSLASSIYWMILIGWIGLILKYKLRESFSLTIAFVLFAAAAIFTTLGFISIGETIMRLSLIGWMIGIVQSVINYEKKGNF